MKCATCLNTGLRLEAGEETETYCDCQIGNMFCMIWEGRNEDELCDAFTKTLEFINEDSE